MTREEAWNRIDIIIATHETDDVYVCLTNEKDYDALRIAREMLREEPCEEAISRQAVLSKIKEVCFSEEWLQFRVDKGSNGQRDFLIDYIEQLPSITPQPKIGRWTADRNCSRCGCRSMLGLCIENYCANCGAKMVELQESEEE